ncbi:MAG TPA: VC0807 family protein [Acidimicrobiales bacterium]|nr:VC0807 family protein [Acidimicrobiales bacterium]
MSDVLVIPNLRAVARRAGHNLVEGKLIPLLVFLSFLKFAGSAAAVVAALVWSMGCITFRLSTGRRVPGLVILTAAGLAARTIAAIATGSMVVYFLQPTASTALVGAAFLISVGVGRPLAEKLAHDFCPFDEATARHPHLRQFFVRLSLLWSFTSMLNAALTLWLLLTQPVTTFMVVKSFIGPGFTTVTLVIAIGWFRFSTRNNGIRFVFASGADPSLRPSPLAVE